MLPEKLARVLSEKLAAGWTGSITLHVKDGRVIEIEQSTKQRVGW